MQKQFRKPVTRTNERAVAPRPFDQYQVQNLIDVIDFYRENGWDFSNVLEFLILKYAGELEGK